MAIAFVSQGTVISGTTQITTAAYGTGWAAGDLIVFTVASNHGADPQNTPTVAGFTSAGSFQGGTGLPAAGTGPRRLTFFTREAQAGDDTTPQIDLTSGNIMLAASTVLSKGAGETWATPVTAFGFEDTAGTAWSQVMTTDPGLAANDMLLLGCAVCDTSNTDAEAVTATGATFGTVTERTDQGSETGNDISLHVATVAVSTGPNSATPTRTATHTTADSGVMGVLRLRVTAGDATVPAATVAAVASVPAPSLQTGSTITATSVAAIAAVPAPTVQTGSTVTATTVAAVAAVPAPTVQAGSVVVATSVSAVAAVPVPTVTTGGGSATVPAATVAAVAAIPAPTVQAGSTVSPAAVNAVAAVPAPTVTTGSTVIAATVAAVTAIPAPAVTTGGSVNIQAVTVTALAAIPAPTLSTGQRVTAVTVAALAAVPAVTVRLGVTITPLTVTGLVAIPGPTLSTSVIVPAFTVAAVATIPTPAIVFIGPPDPNPLRFAFTEPGPMTYLEPEAFVYREHVSSFVYQEG